jgi:hypothetical protein
VRGERAPSRAGSDDDDVKRLGLHRPWALGFRSASASSQRPKPNLKPKAQSLTQSPKPSLT